MKINLLLAALLLMTVSPSWASPSVVEVSLDGDTRYWFSAFSLASVEADAAQDGGSQWSAYNYLSINYAVENGRHWSLRLPFIYESAGYNNFDGNEFQKQQLNLADVLLDYTISSALLPGEIEIFSRYRLELPTSRYSNLQGKIAGLRFDMIASRYISRSFQLEYWPIFTWNIHTQTVYDNPDTGGLSHTKRYELNQRLSLWYRVNHRNTYLGFYVGTEDTWYNESENNNTTRARNGRFAEHLLKVGPSVRYRLNRNFDFLFNLQNSVPMWGYSPDRTGSMSDLGAFKPKQTEFVLLSFISF